MFLPYILTYQSTLNEVPSTVGRLSLPEGSREVIVHIIITVFVLKQKETTKNYIDKYSTICIIKHNPKTTHQISLELK